MSSFSVGSEPGASSKVANNSYVSALAAVPPTALSAPRSIVSMTTLINVNLVDICSWVSSPLACAFCCSFSAVWIMTAAATAATRINAMKTIIAPIPIAASSSCFVSFSVFIFFTFFYSSSLIRGWNGMWVKEHLHDPSQYEVESE